MDVGMMLFHSAANLARIGPVLDEAITELKPEDRAVILLRFFERRDLRSIGEALGTNEDAAQKRVSRALDKMRLLLGRKGVALSATTLGAVLAVEEIAAAPAGLATTITAAVLSGTTTTTAVIAATKTIAMTTLQKTAVAFGVLFATGIATVTVKEIMDHRTYPWQVQNVNTGVLNQVPPQIRIVPTRFPQSGGGVGRSDEKVLGINQTPKAILLTAYGGSACRLVLNAKLPEKKYDFIANLPAGTLQALQDEIKRKFGLIAHYETRLTDVLQLTVKKTVSAGLRPTGSEVGSARTSAGQFSCVNQPLSCLAEMLESSLKLPVVDYTGFNGRFDIDLSWDAPDFQHQNPDALKQTVLDELGLELRPAREAIEMLVVERAK